MRKVFKRALILFILMSSLFMVKVEAAPAIQNNPANIPNLTYIIGEHQIPATTALTPRRVMLAATTIPGEPTIENMIIYFKNHLGQWIDASDGGKSITPPTQFNTTAIYQNGVLYRAVTSVEINETDQIIYIGDTVNLTASISPTNATVQGVSWTVSNNSIATVSSTGVVTGVSPGVTNVTVTSNCGNKTDTIQITVEELIIVADIEFSSTPVDISEVANNETVIITLTTATDDANIYYTLDGSEPTTDSILYDESNKPEITTSNQFGEEIVFKARAFKDDDIPSNILEETIVFKAASEVIVTNANDLNLAIANDDVLVISFGDSFSGNVNAIRLGTTNFTINFYNHTMTGSLYITADSVSEITLNGTATPSLDGALIVSAAVATVNNNINISGEIEILAIGSDSWNQAGNALAMKIRAAVGRITRTTGEITGGVNVEPTSKSVQGLRFGGDFTGIMFNVTAPVVMSIDEDVTGEPDITIDSDDSEIENFSNQTVQITANNDTIVSGNYNKVGGDGEIFTRQTRPTFDPASGAVANGTELTIISDGADAIYYTVDGSEPTEASLEYNELDKPIIGPNITVRAIAINEGYLDSRIGEVSYTAPTMGGSVSIIGDEIFGALLEADITMLEYSPVLILDDDVPTYQWYRNDQIISGATNNTYSLGINDIDSTITVVVSADGTNAIGSVTSSSTGQIDKADGPAAPAAPEASLITHNSITLIPIFGAEYKMGDGQWQDSPVFTGLDYYTDYNFTARIKETSTHYASTASDVNTIRTAEKTVDISVVEGVTPPVKGEMPVTIITESSQFTGTIAWNPSDNPFEPNTQYTATITLEAKEDYTFNGVSENFFTVTNATATNAENSNVVIAEFPATLPNLEGQPVISELPATFGEGLTVNAGMLSVTTNLTYTWYRSSNDTYNQDETFLATGTTYTPVEADIHQYLIVVATTPDAYGYAYAVTEPVEKATQTALATVPVFDPANPPTKDTITLVELENHEYAVASVDGAPSGMYAFQDSNIFTERASGTEYTFVSRIKETDTHKSSAVSGESDIIATVPLSVDAEILTFEIQYQTADTIIDSENGTITIEQPSDWNLNSLVGIFTTSEFVQSVTVNSIPQESGVTPNNFNNPVVYTVVAENGTVKEWTITVNTVDKTALETKITEAIDAKDGVFVSEDGNDILTTEEWITEELMNSFTNAIDISQQTYDNIFASQADVNQKASMLTNQIPIFNDLKQYGSLKIIPVVADIVEATAVGAFDLLSESTLSGTFKHPVTEVNIPGLLTWDDDTVIVEETGLFAWTFTPTNTTDYEIVTGNVEVIAIDRSELLVEITNANNNKTTVVVSVDGSEVSTTEMWVTQSDMDDYETAIAIAQAVYADENVTQEAINTAKDNLVAATDAFNGLTQSGSLKTMPTIDDAVSATAVDAFDLLSESTLSGTFKHPITEVNIPGLLTWDDDTVTVEETGLFAWTFTPTNTTDYEIVTGNVEVIANVDKTELETEINAANINKTTVVVSVDGSEVSTTEMWVTESDMNDYEAAIAAAQAVYGDDEVNQTNVNAAIITLALATTTFNESKQDGSFVEAALWSDLEYYYLNNPENVNVIIELNDSSLTRINDGTRDLVSVDDYEIASIENPYGGTNDNLIVKTAYLDSILNVVLDDVTLMLYFDEGTNNAHTRQLVITALDPIDIYVNVTGDNSTGDGQESSPYATIGKALEVAVMGDTIHIAEGIYEESVIIPVSLSKITLQGSGENTEIRGNLSLEFIPRDEATPAQFPDDVTFDNFKVVGDVFLAPGSTTNNLLIEGDVDAQGGTSITNTHIDGNFEIIGIETSLTDVHITGNAYFGGPSVGLENVTVDGIIYGKILYDFEIKANESTNLYKGQDELQDAYISFKVPQSIADFEAEMGAGRKITIDLNGVQLDPNANWILGDLDDVLDLNVMQWSIELEVKVGQTLAAGTTVVITASEGIIHTTDDNYIYATLIRDHEAPWWDELWYNTSYPLDEFIPDMWANPDRLYVEQYNGEDDEIINETFRLHLMIGDFNETLENTDFRLEGILSGLNITNVERDSENYNQAIITISGPLNISGEEWETRHNQGFGHMDGYIVAIGSAAYSGTEDVSAYISVETPTHEIAIHPNHFEIEPYDDVNVSFEREFEMSLGFEQFNSELDAIDFELGGAFTGQNVTSANLAVTDIRPHDEYDHHVYITISGYLNITDADWSANDNHDIEATIIVKASAHTGDEDYIAAIWLAKFGDGDHQPAPSVVASRGHGGYINLNSWPKNTDLEIIVMRGIEEEINQIVNTGEEDHLSFHLSSDFGYQDGLHVGDEIRVRNTENAETVTIIVEYIEVEVVDPDTNVISGKAIENSPIEVRIYLDGVDFHELPHINTMSDGTGNWSVDFTSDFNLEPHHYGHVLISDENGNGTIEYWHYVNPAFAVYVDDNFIVGFDWEPLTAITIKIDSSVVGTEETDASGYFSFAYSVNIGDEVEISDGTTTRLHIVRNVVITSVDRETAIGTITGTADPNETVLVEVTESGGGYGPPTTHFTQEVQADGSGNWTINANIKIDDNYTVIAAIIDENGNATMVTDEVVLSSSVGLIRVNDGVNEAGTKNIITAAWHIWEDHVAMTGDRGRITVNSGLLACTDLCVTFEELKYVIASDDGSNQTYRMFDSWDLTDGVQYANEVFDGDTISADYHLEVTAEDGTVKYYQISGSPLD